MRKTSAKTAARNAIQLMAQFVTDGKFNHAAFLAEMDARAAIVGTKLTAEQYGTLGKMTAAYCADLGIEQE